MRNNTLVRGAAVAGLAVCALAGGTGVAFAADTATACVNGATNYPDCTPTTGTTTGGGGATGGGTDVPTGGGATTVVAGGAGTGTTESSGAASSLPFTGFEAGAAAAIGLAALGAGTVFIVGSRRRRSNGDSAAA